MGGQNAVSGSARLNAAGTLAKELCAATAGGVADRAQGKIETQDDALVPGATGAKGAKRPKEGDAHPSRMHISKADVSRQGAPPQKDHHMEGPSDMTEQEAASDSGQTTVNAETHTT